MTPDPELEKMIAALLRNGASEQEIDDFLADQDGQASGIDPRLTGQRADASAQLPISQARTLAADTRTKNVAGAKGLAANAVQGATFNLADDVLPEAFGERVKTFQRTNPGMATAAQVAGGFTAPGLGAMKLTKAIAPAGSNLIGRTLANAAVGGTMSGLYGLGDSPDDRAGGFVRGAPMGTALGAATTLVPALAGAVKQAPGRAVNMARGVGNVARGRVVRGGGQILDAVLPDHAPPPIPEAALDPIEILGPRRLNQGRPITPAPPTTTYRESTGQGGRIDFNDRPPIPGPKPKATRGKRPNLTILPRTESTGGGGTIRFNSGSGTSAALRQVDDEPLIVQELAKRKPTLLPDGKRGFGPGLSGQPREKVPQPTPTPEDEIEATLRASLKPTPKPIKGTGTREAIDADAIRHGDDPDVIRAMSDAEYAAWKAKEFGTPNDRADYGKFLKKHGQGSAVRRGESNDLTRNPEAMAKKAELQAQSDALPDDAPEGVRDAIYKQWKALNDEYGRIGPLYHGSPHKFDKFDVSKIGTGEGAQAYGHGLYFAESPSTAHYYRSTLAPDPRDKVNQVLEALVPESSSDDVMFELRRHPELSPFQNDSQFKSDVLDVLRGRNKDGSVTESAMKAFRRLDQALPPKSDGAFYTAELPDATVDDFLHWDKPLGEQSAKVRKAIGVRDVAAEKVGLMDLLDEARQSGTPLAELPRYKLTEQAMDDSPNHRMTGEQFYHSLGGKDKRDAANALRKLGVRGIRYLDGSSRKDGEGSYNYVVFDDADVNILNREGKAATKMLTGTAAASGGLLTAALAAQKLNNQRKARHP